MAGKRSASQCPDSLNGDLLAKPFVKTAPGTRGACIENDWPATGGAPAVIIDMAGCGCPIPMASEPGLGGRA